MSVIKFSDYIKCDYIKCINEKERGGGGEEEESLSRITRHFTQMSFFTKNKIKED